MLSEDDRDIFLLASLDHPQYIPQDGSGDPMEKILHINCEEGGVPLVYQGFSLTIGF
jgi:hypothetical protein